MGISDKFQRSSKLFTEGKYDEAISLMSELLEEEPENIIFWIYLGRIYTKVKKYDDAIDAYRQALDINSKSYSAWQNLGSVFFKKGEYKYAIVALKKALSIDERNVVTLSNLAKVYKKSGNLKNAKQIYIRILKQSPKNALAWSNLGVIYYHEKDYNKVISAFKKAVKIAPNNAFYWNNLGLAYLKRGLLDNAIYACKRALDIDINYKTAWHNLCKAYNTRGLDFQYEVYNTDDFQNWYELAKFLYKANFYKDALDSINRAIKKDPDNKEFLKFKKRIRNILKEKQTDKKSKKIANKVKHSFKFFKKQKNKQTIQDLEESYNINELKEKASKISDKDKNKEQEEKYKISTLINTLSEGATEKEDTVFISEKQYNLVDSLFIIDGANIAYGDTRGSSEAKFSNIEKIVNKLEEMAIHYRIFTDRSLFYKIDNRKKYEDYVKNKKILEMPGGTEADYFILQYAQENDAFIISNDMFKEFYQIFGKDWILEHRVSFKIIEDQVFFDKLIKR